MAALPYMPLFVADYLADTRHLTPAQHGGYLLLIMNYWQTGKPLPNDDARLARIACMSRRDWGHNRTAILEFFTEQESLLVHPRIAYELSRVSAKSLKCKDAAQASVERRFGKRSTGVEPTDTDKDKGSEAKASAELVDAETVMWQRGKAYLLSNGVSASQAGSMLGKWKRDYGAEATIVALGKAQREGALDPVSYITACLGAKRKGDEYNPDRITV